MRDVYCVHQPDFPKLEPAKSSPFVVVAMLQGAKRALQMYVLALVRMDAHVYLYRQLQPDFDFHDSKPVPENWCADPRADVHTGDENDFGVDVEGTDVEDDVIAGP